MRRVLKQSGRILITVPFGGLEIHDSFKQYDLQEWKSVVARAELRIKEVGFYGYSQIGWGRVLEPNLLQSNAYLGGRARAATAVLCAELMPS
jgi:hypothetical protein